MKNDSLNEIKKDYMNPPIPHDLESSIQKGVAQAQREKQRHRFRHTIKKTASIAAAASILFTVALNSSPAFASSFSEIPLINRVVQVLTVKDYQFEQEGYTASVSTPAIDGLENKHLESLLNETYLKESKELYQGFLKEMEEMEDSGGGHLGLHSGYEVVTDNEQILSIRRYVVNTVGSSSTTYHYDTIDKENELFLTLPSLFKDDAYIEVISQSIKEQMMDQHRQDPDQIYWLEGMVEDPDLVDLFHKIDPSQNFYISEDATLVISFDKYEVAPGYMGVAEFQIPTDILKPLLVSNEYLK